MEDAAVKGKSLHPETLWRDLKLRGSPSEFCPSVGFLNPSQGKMGMEGPFFRGKTHLFEGPFQAPLKFKQRFEFPGKPYPDDPWWAFLGKEPYAGKGKLKGPKPLSSIFHGSHQGRELLLRYVSEKL